LESVLLLSLALKSMLTEGGAASDERNHQGLDNRLIEKPQGEVDMNSAVVRNERLGGVLNYYERRAA
jgi:hypothetical protein